MRGLMQILHTKYLFFLALCCILHKTPVLSKEENDFVIASYLPDYRSYININKPAKFMTDVILFSINPSSSGKLSDSTCCLESMHYFKAREARYGNPDLKIFVSIGGGGRSESFANLLSTENGRETFANELVQLCHKEDLNGIDLDWEGIATREEYISYVLFIRKLSKFLHQEGMLLSIALHAQQFFPKEVYENVDRVNLMAYDLIQLGGDHHASYENVENAVEKLIQSGCKSTKIVVGMPAYGRHKNSPEKVKTYSDIMEAIYSSSTPSNEEIFAKNQSLGFMYDSPNMVKEKVKMALGKKLKGVFLWELGQDYYYHNKYSGGLLIESASRAKEELLTAQHKKNDKHEL